MGLTLVSSGALHRTYGQLGYIGVVFMARPLAPERKDEVLELVIAYLAENGLANLTVRKVAMAIDASTNVIFYQFGSKEKLIEAALSRARKANRQMLEDLRAEKPAATMADAFREIWTWWMRDPPRLAYSRLNMEAMMTDSALSHDARAELLEYWIEYFSSWLVSDGHSPSKARLLATMALSLQSGLTIDLISTGDRSRLDATVLEFSRILEPPTTRP